ncbi:MAG TPA: tail fiber domain-containing protein [Hanamia sp.]|nr:tail fiber domain-containing protein [Hanamia sp.]
MKKYLCIIITVLTAFVSTKISAQVKIGDNPTTVNSASLLELESGNKGLLLPRLSDTTSISNPPQGMFMFNNTDTSLYFRRNLGGWTRLSLGWDNYWKYALMEGSNKLLRIYSEVPVRINSPAGAFLDFAPFQTTGMFGNTLAAFGDGVYDNIAGISLVGNLPGIYFNSYYNSGNRNMANGYSGDITLDNSGGNYDFNFNDNAASPNTLVTHHTKMSLSKDGKLGLNTGIPSRAWMEEQGAVNNACAIFGGEGSGVSIQEHFPSIGFNSYFDGGSGYKSIGAGYGGEIGIDQNSGDFYVTTMKGKTIAGDQAFINGFVRTFNINSSGNVGINTTDPLSQLEIVNYGNSVNSSNGLTFTSPDDVFGDIGGFNLSAYDFNGSLTNPGQSFLVFQARSTTTGNFAYVANIDDQGNYHQLSDARTKKDIASLDKSSMLQKLLSLKPSNYHFTNQNTNTPKSYGFIAQDVEQVFPEFVNTIQNKKMLAYSSFIPVIVAAMQEQQQEIETLKMQNRSSAPSVQNENTDLQNQVSALTELVKQLQQQVNALQKQGK